MLRSPTWQYTRILNFQKRHQRKFRHLHLLFLSYYTGYVKLIQTKIRCHFISRQYSSLILKRIKEEELRWFDGRGERHKLITDTSQSRVWSEQQWLMFFYEAFVLSRRSEANLDKLPRVVSLESTPAGPENHSVRNWKGPEAWSREKVGLLSHMAWVSPQDRIVFYWSNIMRICMMGPNEQDSVSRPEL